jgi:DNA polymerase III epsilon subunit-like protein
MTKRRFTPYNEAGHLVVDIETLGKVKGALVLSIGAVFMKEDADIKTFYRNISLQDSILAGFNVDPETQQWWSEQNPEIFKDTIKDGAPLVDVIKEFAEFIKECDPHYFWGNSFDFDFGILEPYFNKAGVDIPWNYGLMKCVRTYLDPGVVTESIRDEYKQKLGNRAHHAMFDALYEASLLAYGINQAYDYDVDYKFGE